MTMTDESVRTYALGDTVTGDDYAGVPHDPGVCSANVRNSNGTGYGFCTRPAGHGVQHVAAEHDNKRVCGIAPDPEPIVEEPTREVLAERLAIAKRELGEVTARLSMAQSELVEVRAQRTDLDRRLTEAGEKHEELRKQVVKTARRLAREHDWCSVVDAGLREMGLGDVEYEQRYRVTTDVWIEHGSWEARQEGIEVVVESTRGGGDAWRDVDDANEETAIDMLNAAGIYLPDGWSFRRFDASTGYAEVADED